MLHFVAEVITVVDDVNNAFGRLAIFTSRRKTLIWLNDIREYLEGYVTVPILDYARRSMAVAALCLICSGASHNHISKQNINVTSEDARFNLEWLTLYR